MLGVQRPSLNKVLKDLERDSLIAVRYAVKPRGLSRGPAETRTVREPSTVPGRSGDTAVAGAVRPLGARRRGRDLDHLDQTAFKSTARHVAPRSLATPR
ncbi:hypothetical protein [Actinomadura sp. 3N407]|uniref:hypothetical protein n=1 Tax=Actinomadura sp. 3N407 TaxID=3457423 RepID=UPI003FCE440A